MVVRGGGWGEDAIWLLRKRSLRKIFLDFLIEILLVRLDYLKLLLITFCLSVRRHLKPLICYALSLLFISVKPTNVGPVVVVVHMHNNNNMMLHNREYIINPLAHNYAYVTHMFICGQVYGNRAYR